MRGGKFNLCKARDSMPQYQRGVVLLIALIVLVAMTLAGIGMMRSIDTTTLIAGNVAFKQTTIQAGDRGISEGFNNVLLRASSDPLDKPVLSWTTGSACPAGVSAALCPGGNINLPGYAAAPLQACEVDNTCPPVSRGGCRPPIGTARLRSLSPIPTAARWRPFPISSTACALQRGWLPTTPAIFARPIRNPAPPILAMVWVVFNFPMSQCFTASHRVR